MVGKVCILVLVLIVFSAAVQAVEKQRNNMSRLMNYLMKSSNSSVLPVVKDSSIRKPLTVKLGVTLYQIINVDNKNQIVTLALFMRQRWHNELLHWDPNDFGELNSTNIAKDKLWVPDIYIYNHAEGGSKSALDQWKTPITIKSNGHCSWLAPGVVKTSCKLNVRYFPFDEQQCKIKFGSWTYNGYQLDVQPDHDNGQGDTTNFVKSGEWDLDDFAVKRNVEHYACCEEPYPDVTFTLLIKRRTRYYYINMLLPNMFITALTLVAFFLPPDCGERISLIITNFLAMVVFLLLVAEILPPNSEVTPMISIYCAGLMCEVGLALVASCFVLRLYCRHSGFDQMPSWIQKVVLTWLAKLTFTTSLVAKVKEDTEQKAVKFIELFKTGQVPGSKIRKRSGKLMEAAYLLAPEWDSTYDLASDCEEDDEVFSGAAGKDKGQTAGEPWSTHNSVSRRSSSPDQSSSTCDHVNSVNVGKMTLTVQGNKNCICSSLVEKLDNRQKSLIEHVSNMTSMLTDQEINAEKKKEWQLASSILDRSFLVFFIVGLVVSSLAIFLQIPRS